jgi:hypothetical protein
LRFSRGIARMFGSCHAHLIQLQAGSRIRLPADILAVARFPGDN